MKPATKHLFRSCVSVLLALCMVIGLPLTALAADNGAAEKAAPATLDSNGDGKITYVSFGDSVTNGYGMDDYRYSDGTNVYGFRREPAAAYPVQIREYLAKQTGMTVELEQMAISGFRMDELDFMLNDEYVPDDYHNYQFANWNRNVVEKLILMDDAFKAKYESQYDGTRASADAIIQTEYRNAVKKADLISIDLGTNNFGTFVTNTIQEILGLKENRYTIDFAQYVDANTAQSLEAMLSQMAMQLSGAESTKEQGYQLTYTLAKCLMYGYLGFTAHFDAAVESIYELNPDAQIVVIDCYTMITGVDLVGESLGDGIDLDEMYDLFIDMANFYTRELSPYAHKVTHASLLDDEGNAAAPELFIDYFKNYPDAGYPDNQYLYPTAERLMNEFIMEAMDYDPDEPEEREQFNEDVLKNIKLLDSYVNDLQNIVKTNVIDTVDAQIKEKLDPVVELVDTAIEGVETAQEAVDTAVEGVAAAEDAVDQAVAGVATAKTAVSDAVNAVALAQSIVDLLVANLIEGEYSQYFSGSETNSLFEGIIVDKIKEYITDDLMQQAGFEVSDENRTALAEEAYVMACVYYDELNYNGGTKESANRLAIIEGVSYMLVETRGYTEAEAQATAEQAYALNDIYQTHGEAAAVKAAIESVVTDELMTSVGAATKAEAAETVYYLGTADRETAVKAAMASQVGEETAELGYQLNTIVETEGEDAAVKAALMTEVDEATADQALALYAVYENALASDKDKDEDAAFGAAVVAAMVNQGGYEQELAEAIYAVYAKKASADQAQLAYVSLMVGTGILEETATAIYTCYATKLDGQYNDPNVQTTMIYFMVYTGAAKDESTAKELYSSYLSYKNLPTTLSKIAKCPTIYFDALLTAAAGGLNLDAIGQKFMAGTLALDEPVREKYETEEEYKEALALYKSDSALATLYFRFMTQDGVFTHPSEDGQDLLTSAVKKALANLNVAEADSAIDGYGQVLVLGDNIAATEGGYADQLNTILNENVTTLAADGLRINEVRALLDDGYAGDEYTQTVLGSDASTLSATYKDAVAASDVVVLNLGAMNMGFLVPQLDLYMDSNGKDTYAMNFTEIENMAIQDLGTKVDAFLSGFEKSFTGENADVTTGTLMLSLETYGYGYTTFCDCLDDTVEAIKALNPDADIVLVGQYDMLGGAIYRANNMYLELGDFIGHALDLMNRYMATYAEMNADVTYVDVTATEHSSTEGMNIPDVGFDTAFAAAMPTDAGHTYMAKTIACALGAHAPKEESDITWGSWTENNTMTASFACANCAEDVKVDAKVTRTGADPTCTDASEYTYTATVLDYTCSKTKTVEIGATGHTKKTDAAVAATCTKTGLTEGSHCSVCGTVITEQKTVAATGHSYGKPTWTWAEDYASATASFTCTSNDDTQVVNATVTSSDNAPTCTEDGYATYTATVEFGGKTYTDTQKQPGTVAGHTYGEPTGWTWSEDCSSAQATFVCSVCDETTEGHTISKDATVTSKTTDATCVSTGKTVYTATVDGYSDTKEVEIPADGIHDYGTGHKCVHCGAQDPAFFGSCTYETETNLTAGQLTLALGGTKVGTYTFAEADGGWTIRNADGTYVALDEDGNLVNSSTAFVWTYSGGTFSATVTTSGGSWLDSIFGGFGGNFGGWWGSGSSSTTYYLVASGSGLGTSTSSSGANATFYVTGASEMHTFGDGVVTEPTCTADGYTTYTCASCGYTYTDSQAAATGHDYQTYTKAPTCTEAGYTNHTCASCGDSYNDAEVPATGHTMTDGVCSACGYTEGTDPEPEQGECVYLKSVSLSSGKLILTLGGTNVGTYTFTQVDGGWTIQNADGAYLALSSGSLVTSNSAYTWTYSGGRFSATESGSSSSGSWFDKLFGGFGNWFGSGSSSTTYYLAASGSSVTVSTSTTNASAGFYVQATGEHVYGDPAASNGSHVYTCANCGYQSSVACNDEECQLCNPTATVNVSVSVTSSSSGSGSWFEKLFGSFGNWFGSGSSKTYTATISVTADGTEVKSVEYSTNGGSTWTTGTSFTSSSEITAFLIRVTGTNGVVYQFSYSNGTVTPIA